MKNLVYIFLFVFSSLSYAGITNPPETPIPLRVPGIVVGVDTFAYISLPIITVEAQMPFATKKKYAQWTRLKYNVKKAYPYAILASARLKEYEKVLATIPSEDGKKAYMKVAEKKLQQEFGPELKNLSFSSDKKLDFSVLADRIEDLSVYYHKKITNLETLQKVVELSIYNDNNTVILPENIEELKLVQSKRTDFEGLHHLKKLKDLEFHYCPKIESLDTIPTILEKVHI